MKDSIVKDKAFRFLLKSIELYKALCNCNEYVLSKQFLRSATSIGANINEALAGYSKKDFAAKMSIAPKEARESKYWLELIEQGKFITFDYSLLHAHCSELIKMLTSIVKTSQIRLKEKQLKTKL